MSDQNLISATLSSADRDAALADLAAFDAKLPFLLGLSVTDRVELQKMGNTRRAFVEQTVNIAAQNPQVFPASFDVAEFQKDMDLYLQLAPIMDAIQLRYEKVNDTMLAVGSDLYTAALEAYGYIKSAGKSQGLDALRQQLKSSRQRAPQAKSQTPPASK
jgi:hypothetical protein